MCENDRCFGSDYHTGVDKNFPSVSVQEFKAVSKEDSGRYSCQASNGVGQPQMCEGKHMTIGVAFLGVRFPSSPPGVANYGVLGVTAEEELIRLGLCFCSF